MTFPAKKPLHVSYNPFRTDRLMGNRDCCLVGAVPTHKTKGCQKVVKNVVNIDIFMVVTLKVVKVVSADNEKVKKGTVLVTTH